MKAKYYTRAKMSQIILDLIYLLDEMRQDGYTDKQSLKDLQKALDILKYYRQFLND